MATLAQALKATPDNYENLPHAPWMGRPALWGIRRDRYHLVIHAAPVGRSVVQALACGGATTFWGLEITTWYGMMHRRRRVCRRCLAILARAGEAGPIRRPTPVSD